MYTAINMLNLQPKLAVILFLTAFNAVVIHGSQPFSEKDRLKAELLPECQACKQLVDSFKKGIERTSRYKFEGGDATWEEKKQGKYAESEVRLTEIQEELCKDVIKGQVQCHKLAAENEENFERWWFHEQREHPELYDWLCIQTIKECCPVNMYGPDCTPCPGGMEKPCSGNGKCRGAGTRKGIGECRCNHGYTGAECTECNTGYYREATENGFVCLACHKACKGHCRDGTSKGCEVCWEGWLNHPELGCQDIDECSSGEVTCPSDQFCANTEGSYRCLPCHISCASCFGDGPDECIACQMRYNRKGNLCVDSSEWMRSVHTQWGRYFTYLGLCIATFIILKKSVFTASIIGLIVAIYIAVSEYVASDANFDTPDIHFLPTSTK